MEIPVTSSVPENWSESTKNPGMEGQTNSSTEPCTESTSQSTETSEVSSIEEITTKSSTNWNQNETNTETWSETTSVANETSETPCQEETTGPSTSVSQEESSTEMCIETTSEASETSETPCNEETTDPSTSGNQEESTDMCSESTPEANEMTEEPCKEETTEASTDGNQEESTEMCAENISESSASSSTPANEEVTEKPCTDIMEAASPWGKTIKGPIAPVFAPVGMDREFDCTVIPEYMEYLNMTGVAAIVVGGTTGEALTMSPCQRKAVLEIWIKEALKYGIKVIAQVGGADEPSVLELARHAQEVGACGILLLPQMFYKPKNTNELVTYMELVSEQAPELFLIYYDFPMMTGVTVNMTELFDMATKRIPNFKGVKSDLKTIFEAGGLLKDGQQIYLGNHHIASAVLMGHESSIATVNNMFLDLVRQIIEAVHSRNVREARRLQKKLNKIVAEISDIGDFQATMKAAFELITGIKIGPVRRPQTPLTNEKRMRVRDVLKRNGIALSMED